MLCLGLKKSLLSPRLELIAQGMAQCTAFCVHISNYLTTYVQFFSSHYLCPILFLSLPISNSLSHLCPIIFLSLCHLYPILILSLPMSNYLSLTTYVQFSLYILCSVSLSHLCPILSLSHFIYLILRYPNSNVFLSLSHCHLCPILSLSFYLSHTHIPKFKCLSISVSLSLMSNRLRQSRSVSFSPRSDCALDFTRQTQMDDPLRKSRTPSLTLFLVPPSHIDSLSLTHTNTHFNLSELILFRFLSLSHSTYLYT